MDFLLHVCAHHTVDLVCVSHPASISLLLVTAPQNPLGTHSATTCRPSVSVGMTPHPHTRPDQPGCGPWAVEMASEMASEKEEATGLRLELHDQHRCRGPGPLAAWAGTTSSYKSSISQEREREKIESWHCHWAPSVGKFSFRLYRFLWTQQIPFLLLYWA